MGKNRNAMELRRAQAHAKRASDALTCVRIALGTLATDRTWLDAASIGALQKELEAGMLQAARALDTLTPGSRAISTAERTRRALGFYPMRGAEARR